MMAPLRGTLKSGEELMVGVSMVMDTWHRPEIFTGLLPVLSRPLRKLVLSLRTVMPTGQQRPGWER